MWKQYNPNPEARRVGDCTVRAISKATGKEWDRTYLWLCIYGFIKKDMPDANHCWESYLKDHGFKKRLLPDECPDCYTVEQFCADHPHGTYILATGSHVICVVDGDNYDSWDSSDEVPTHYFVKEEL